MDALPPSPASALRSLRHHDPSRGGSPSDAVSGGRHRDAYRIGNAQLQQQQRQQHPLPRPPSPAPTLSLRRILEQRNLLPPSSAATPPPPPGVKQYDGASHSHSPLPSLQFARMSRDLIAGRHEFPHAHQVRRRSTASSDGDDQHNSGSSSSNAHQHRAFAPQRQQASQARRHETSVATPPGPPLAQESNTQPAPTVFGHSRRRTMTPEERRKARTCVVDGCSNYIVDRHRCFRHGGGKRCSIDGCNSSAKQLGLCWRHGGSVLCKVEGCNRGVKVRGLCWGHGGGKKKKKKQIADGSVQATTPFADSFEPRCIFDGCLSAAFMHSFCDAHSREVVRPGYIFEL